MAKDQEKAVHDALAQVSNGRRGFLKGLLIGSALIGSAAIASVPLLKSEALAQDTNTDTSAPKKKKKKTDTNTGGQRF
jgi:hypothetical protein